jgi:hypothetical protein
MIHPVKNQHYVPQFLLRNFSSNSGTHIWAFDANALAKKWKAIKNRSIQSVASDEYFYDKEIDHVHDSFEYQLGQIENSVAPVIARLIRLRDLSRLSGAERRLLSLFIALQMLRTKGGLLNIDRIMTQIHDGIKAMGAPLEKDDPRVIWKLQIAGADIYAELLLKKRWLLQICDKQFYLSDNPVVFANTANPPGIRGTLGINSGGIEIYLPLSNSVTLNLLCERFYECIDEGTYELKPINIEYCNSLQVRAADRFVFSSVNDFSLAIDMLESN